MVSRTHGELSKFNKKTSNKNPSLKKMVKYLNRHFTKEDERDVNKPKKKKKHLIISSHLVIKKCKVINTQ